MTTTNVAEWREIITDNKRVIGTSRIIAEASLIYMNTVNDSWKIVRYNTRLLLVGLLISAIAVFFSMLPVTLEAVNPLVIGIPLTLSVIVAIAIGFITIKVHVAFIDHFPPDYLTDPNVCKQYVTGSREQAKMMQALKVLYTDFIYYMAVMTLIFAAIATSTMIYPEYQLIKIISAPVSLIITFISITCFIGYSIYVAMTYKVVSSFKQMAKGADDALIY